MCGPNVRSSSSAVVAAAAVAAAPAVLRVFRHADGTVYILSGEQTFRLDNQGNRLTTAYSREALDGPQFQEFTRNNIADRKSAAQDATGFKLRETVATFDGVSVVVGFGRVNLPQDAGKVGVEPARVLLTADLSRLAAEGVTAISVHAPHEVFHISEHPDNDNKPA